jgi:hypothetical protein
MKKKTTTKKSKPMGCGLLNKQAKKPKTRPPTSSDDAMKLIDLDMKLQASRAKANELNGVIAVLRREFPDREFDSYTPGAVLVLCQEYKKLAAKTAGQG